MAHSNWPEWIYVGVVIALLCYVGAEAWNIENLIAHVPEEAEVIQVTASNGFGVSSTRMALRRLVSFI